MRQLVAAVAALALFCSTACAQTPSPPFFHGHPPTGINVGSGPPPSQSLSAPWLQTDIGSPPVAGTAYDTQNVLTNSGSGDFHKDTSAFHFVYQAKTGDWRIDFNLTSLTGAGQYRSCGPAILDSLGSDVKYVYLTPSFATGKADFGGRTTTGAGVYETQTMSSANFSTGILRIEKIGSVFTGYMSTDGGMSFSTVGTSTWTPAGTFYIGVHDDSGESSTLSTCTGSMPTLTSLSSSGPGTASFVSSSASVAETVGTTQICVQRSVDTSGGVTVDIQNAGTGTAVAGTDFNNIFPATSGWANGVGGQTCATLTVLNRAGTQGSRTLNLALGNATGGVSIGSPSTMAITITDGGATKTAFGYWGLIQSCYHVGSGCTLATVLNTVATEICPQQYVQGLSVLASWSLAEGDTLGDYTGDGTRGFSYWDQVRDALRGCGKKLDVTFRLDEAGDNPSTVAPDFFPAYVVQNPYVINGVSYGTSGTCGAIATCAYGLQAIASGGSTARGWLTAVRDRQIAVMQAYCARYETDPTWFSLSFNYDSNPPTQQAQWVQNELAINTATRAACPTMDIRLGITFWSGSNSVGAQIIANNATNDSDLRGTDVILPANGGQGWAQMFFLGYVFDAGGNFTLTGGGVDQRGVQRWSEEVEGADMCERWHQTPAEMMNYLVSPSDGTRPHYPSRVVVAMLTYCDPTYGWAAWKSYINSTLGKLYNGHDSTPRTPAELNTMWCESGMVCP